MLIHRYPKNPILAPIKQHPWEAEAAFNGCAVRDGDSIRLLYRALSTPMDHAGAHLALSTIGSAESVDGFTFKNRRQIIKPEHDWERFGCEDPRVTKLEDFYYIFYTALSAFPFGPDGIKIGVAVTKDFVRFEKHPVTFFNAKAMALFPERIGGKIVAMLTVHTDKPPAKICLALFDRPEELWSEAYWKRWYANVDAWELRLRRDIRDQVEVGAPPVRTSAGWLFIYSYIRDYLTPPAGFGVEGVLLDLKNPSRILGTTRDPLLVPHEEYERYGKAPNIVFPSGALIKNRKLFLYYGAADTSVAVATAALAPLLAEMRRSPGPAKLWRPIAKPLLEPDPHHAWEAKAVFNVAAFVAKQKVHIVYRAQSGDNTSVFGYAVSGNGITIDERMSDPIYTPREAFEQKTIPNGNSGCEDPRITEIGGKLYLCYTAYDGHNPPRVALTSISTRDFLARRTSWTRPVLVSPPGMDDKDAAVFPKKINGKYAILHRLGLSIWIDFVDSLAFRPGQWLGGHVLMDPRPGEHDSRKIGIAGPPIKTKHGWLLLYHGISKKQDHHYHLRAALLDLRDPTKILARTRDPILEPELPFEKEGLVPNIVFSCGAVILGEQLFVYYGGADKVTGVASANLNDFLKKLVAEKSAKR